jgi:hypothetical protein
MLNVVVIIQDYLFFVVSLSIYFLGFGPDLQIGGAPRSRKHLGNFILPLGSGVANWLHKVHLSTCSLFHVGVWTSDS